MREFGRKVYEEIAFYCVIDCKPSFLSFTSDGKLSEGLFTDGSNIDPQATTLEAELPVLLERMIHWQNKDGGFNLEMESKNNEEYVFGKFLQIIKYSYNLLTCIYIIPFLLFNIIFGEVYGY